MNGKERDLDGRSGRSPATVLPVRLWHVHEVIEGVGVRLVAAPACAPTPTG